MKKILYIAIACATFPLAKVAHANEPNIYQEYYDASSDVISNIKKCTSTQDQFSANATNCYIEKSKYIKGKTQELYNKNKAFFETRYRESGINSLNINNTSQINQLKQSCVNSYPQPLRMHFKNQILECQAQIDTQRFFYFYTYLLNS